MSTGDVRPNIEVSRTGDDEPELAALGLSTFDLSSRMHDAINGAVNGAAPSWVEGLRAVIER